MISQGTDGPGFVAGNGSGSQLYIQEADVWLQSPYGSALQSNLSGKWFVSVYNVKGNYLQTLYATDGGAGLAGVIKSFANRGGIILDNLNPLTDLEDSTVNCYG